MTYAIDIPLPEPETYGTDSGPVRISIVSGNTAHAEPLLKSAPRPPLRDTRFPTGFPVGPDLFRLPPALVPRFTEFTISEGEDGIVEVSLAEFYGHRKGEAPATAMQALVERFIDEHPGCVAQARRHVRPFLIRSWKDELARRYSKSPEQVPEVTERFRVAWPLVARLPEPWRTLLWEHRLDPRLDDAPPTLGPLIAERKVPTSLVEQQVWEAHRHFVYAASAVRLLLMRQELVGNIEQMIEEERREDLVTAEAMSSPAP